jgi:hypothetical protein
MGPAPCMGALAGGPGWLQEESATLASAVATMAVYRCRMAVLLIPLHATNGGTVVGARLALRQVSGRLPALHRMRCTGVIVEASTLCAPELRTTASGALCPSLPMTTRSKLAACGRISGVTTRAAALPSKSLHLPLVRPCGVHQQQRLSGRAVSKLTWSMAAALPASSPTNRSNAVNSTVHVPAVRKHLRPRWPRLSHAAVAENCHRLQDSSIAECAMQLSSLDAHQSPTRAAPPPSFIRIDAQF